VNSDAIQGRPKRENREKPRTILGSQAYIDKRQYSEAPRDDSDMSEDEMMEM